jgi:hypothetical protein
MSVDGRTAVLGAAVPTMACWPGSSRAIENPVFFASFLGAPALAIAALADAGDPASIGAFGCLAYALWLSGRSALERSR